MDSINGLTIQCAGIFLVAILSYFTNRFIERKFLEYWTLGWGFMALALSSLVVAFRIPFVQPFLVPVYCLGEYCFGYFFLAGCRNYMTGYLLTRRDARWFVPGGLVAVALAQLAPSFDHLFIPHAAIMAGLFGASLYTLREAGSHGPLGLGMRVMRAALTLLTIDFLHYIPIFIYALTHENTWVGKYLSYTSIYDLIFEILLGFATVMVVMEDVRHQVECANKELVAARDRLEVLVRMDPLTEALNRHAFYSFVENGRVAPAPDAAQGCAVVVDIDNLKPINDQLGHAAGDAAIRAVARAIRSIIRADDLLFRWGGDEFLILLLNMAEVDACSRIDRLNAALGMTRLPGALAPVPVIVSYGLAPFAAMKEVERAIEHADGAMYARKQERKAGQRQAV